MRVEGEPRPRRPGPGRSALVDRTGVLLHPRDERGIRERHDAVRLYDLEAPAGKRARLAYALHRADCDRPALPVEAEQAVGVVITPAVRRRR